MDRRLFGFRSAGFLALGAGYILQERTGEGGGRIHNLLRLISIGTTNRPNLN